MYVKKNDVEYWINEITTNLQGIKDKGYHASLESTYNQAFGKISILFHLHLITEARWNKITDEMWKIAHE